MASKRYRDAFRQVMAHVRGMSDDEFLELVRSQEGTLGRAFGVPGGSGASEFYAYASPQESTTWRLDFEPVGVEFVEFTINSANDDEYPLAA
jgi:hypothetical protein